MAYFVQLLQVPIFISQAPVWKFIAGIIVSLTLSGQRLGLFGGLEATWLFGAGDLRGLPLTVGINVAPIIVMVRLFRTGKLDRRDVACATSPSRPAV